jgi:ketosteroid isomerase-like protein
MSRSDVTALQDAYAAFGRGDFDTARKILAPDVTWTEHGKGMPYSGTWHGPDSVVKDVWTHFGMYWGGPGVAAHEAYEWIDAGDHIVVTGRFTGKDNEGRTLDSPCAHVWSMSNGAATRFDGYNDWTV